MTKETISMKLTKELKDRPAAVLVQVASKYESSIYIEYDSKNVNAKSIMGMMALGTLSNGEEVTITADGTDEEQAIEDIVNYLTAES